MSIIQKKAEWKRRQEKTNQMIYWLWRQTNVDQQAEC